jgi:ATP synthase protein I
MKTNPPEDEDPFVREVRRQAEHFHHGRHLTFWEGLAMVGAVGWMIALPSVAGALVGRWLDSWMGTGLFCTLCLLLLGLLGGCISAWRHVRGELNR